MIYSGIIEKASQQVYTEELRIGSTRLLRQIDSLHTSGVCYTLHMMKLRDSIICSCQLSCKAMKDFRCTTCTDCAVIVQHMLRLH